MLALQQQASAVDCAVAQIFFSQSMLHVMNPESLLRLTAVVIVEATSEMQCEAMLQPALPALPLSADQLEAILSAQPVHAMPVQQDVFQSFGSSPVKQMFVVDDGSAVTLARIISTQLTFRLLLGGKPDTAYNVNSSLITPLFHLDNLANNSCQGFLSA